MLLRLLSILFFCFSFLCSQAQIGPSLTFVKRKNSSTTYTTPGGNYCSCIPQKGKSVSGILIGADSSRIYIASGKVISGHDTIKFYGNPDFDLNEKNWISTDTVSFAINDLYRVVVYQKKSDHTESGADRFIEGIFEPTGRVHAGYYIGAFIIGIPIMIIVYPTEYLIHPDNRRMRSFDMKVWNVKR
jgi:hypothetical protein